MEVEGGLMNELNLKKKCLELAYCNILAIEINDQHSRIIHKSSEISEEGSILSRTT